MKKTTLIITVGLTFASFVLSGCGKESKLNAMMDKFDKCFSKLVINGRFATPNSDLDCSQFHPAYEKYSLLEQEADKQIDEINKLVKGDRNLLMKVDLNKNISIYQRWKRFTGGAEFDAKTHRANYGCNLVVKSDSPSNPRNDAMYRTNARTDVSGFWKVK